MTSIPMRACGIALAASILCVNASAQSLSADIVDSLARSLDSSTAPLPATETALEVLYWLALSENPEIEALVQEHLLEEARLHRLVELAERAGERGAVADAILERIAFQGPEIRDSRLVDSLTDNQWTKDVGLDEEQIWLQLSPELLTTRRDLSLWMDCFFRADLIEILKLGERRFLRVAETLGGPSSTVREVGARESPLWIRMDIEPDCESGRIDLTFSEPPRALPAQLSDAGLYRGELSAKSLTIRVPVEKGTTYRFETRNLEAMVDTSLRLLSPEDRPIIEDDDGGSELFASRLEWTAPDAGILSLEISRVGDAQGKFDLEVERDPATVRTSMPSLGRSTEDAARLDPGDSALADLSGGDAGYAVFSTRPGCKYTVSFSPRFSVTGESVTDTDALFLPPVGGQLEIKPVASHSWLSLDGTGEVRLRVQAGKPAQLRSCAAESPWCTEATRAEEIRLIEDSRCPEAPSDAVRISEAPLVVEEQAAWLLLEHESGESTDGEEVDRFALRIPGEREGVFHAVCRRAGRPCRMVVSPSPQAQESATSDAEEIGETDEEGVLAYSFPDTGEYLLKVDRAREGSTTVWLRREETYDGFGVGDCVRLGEHTEVGGTRNWNPRMKEFVGESTRLSEHRGRERVGAWIVRVAADDRRWVWRTQNMAPSDECPPMESTTPPPVDPSE